MTDQGRLLIVEDHAPLAGWMRTELAHAGWAVSWAKTSAEAVRLVERGTFGVILIDIGLPDEDGITLCRRLRQSTTASILMVTARQEVADRVQALDGGADDYLPKPFAVEELLARIRAVLRRAQHQEGPVVEWEQLRLWPDERRVEWQGGPLTVSRREFDLLAVLLRHPSRVYRREELVEAVWGFDFDGESNVVDVTVGRLRDRLATSEIDVVAVRGVGYRLERRL
ncbi:MAG: response regulator transcription factor [Sulfobacillus sp.]